MENEVFDDVMEDDVMEEEEVTKTKASAWDKILCGLLGAGVTVGIMLAVKKIKEHVVKRNLKTIEASIPNSEEIIDKDSETIIDNPDD